MKQSNKPINRIATDKQLRYFGSTTQYNMKRKTTRFILDVSAKHRKI